MIQPCQGFRNCPYPAIRWCERCKAWLCPRCYSNVLARIAGATRRLKEKLISERPAGRFT